MRHATESAAAAGDLTTGWRWLCAWVVTGGWLATAIGHAHPGTDEVVSAGTSVEAQTTPQTTPQSTAQAQPSKDTLPLQPGSPEPAQPAFVVRSLRGRVGWLAEVLARRHQVQTVPEAAERILVLETDTGQLFPLVEDVRGRAFRGDQRLREMNVELLVRQHQGSPMVQVIQVFEITAEGRWELDYWCEICAIAMFELKPCDCCQAPNELRRRQMPAAK